MDRQLCQPDKSYPLALELTIKQGWNYSMGVQIKTFAIKALIGASLGTRRFQRAGVDYCLLGSPERLEPIRMLAIDKQIIQARPIPAPLIPISAPRAETARWKRRVPRSLPIYQKCRRILHPSLSAMDGVFFGIAGVSLAITLCYTSHSSLKLEFGGSGRKSAG